VGAKTFRADPGATPMPAQTQFDFHTYCHDPAYPGTLEFWLTDTPLDDPTQIDLATYREVAGAGLPRVVAPREKLFRVDGQATDGGVIDSLQIFWAAKTPTPTTITGVLLVGRFPGENPQLLAKFEQPWTFQVGGKGMTFSCSGMLSRNNLG
jgi:hypothetical protein